MSDWDPESDSSNESDLDDANSTRTFSRDVSPHSVVGYTVFRPPSPPIFKLHQELLWYIFLINSHTQTSFNTEFDARDPCLTDFKEANTRAALIINRHTSQVCRSWRELMLKSSSIWANSINVQLLNQREDHWRKEVMRRTGNALLTVVGEMDHQPTGISFYSTPFILGILEEKWEQVRSLAICAWGQLLYERLRLLSQRPAPNLRSFTHLTSLSRERISPMEHFVPFSDHAPQLRSFCDQTNEFRLTGSCFGDLRHFWLNCSKEVFTAAEILQSLQQMPMLETLYFERIRTNPKRRGETSKVVRLLHLKCLMVVDINEMQGAMLNVIPYIKVGKGCKLTVRHAKPSKHCVVTAFSDFFKNNVDPSNIAGVSFKLNDRRNSEERRLRVGFSNVASTLDHLSIDFLMFEDICDIFYSMAKSLSLINLRNAGNLIFSVKCNDVDGVLGQKSMVDVIAFLRTLESVSELHTDNHTLRFLRKLEFIHPQKVSKSRAATLPNLSLLRTDIYHGELISYCRRRHALGTPLRHVHVQYGEPVLPSSEWSGLDMAISWTQRS